MYLILEFGKIKLIKYSLNSFIRFGNTSERTSKVDVLGQAVLQLFQIEFLNETCLLGMKTSICEKILCQACAT